MSGLVPTAHVFVEASKIANAKNQTVGEKNDLYVTLEQLEAILQKLQRGPESA